MHGNTVSTASGLKTRNFVDILAEIESSFAVHRSVGSELGGIHFKRTGEDVTKCIGSGSPKPSSTGTTRACATRA